jgi:hypothetical protein
MGKKSRQKRLRRSLRPFLEKAAQELRNPTDGPIRLVPPPAHPAKAPPRPRIILPTAKQTVLVEQSRLPSTG